MSLEKVFAAEDKELSNKRASYTVVEDSEGTTITLQAEDAIAFRAMINGVGKILAIHEKMSTVE